jgi:hypothetical protein
LYAFGKPNLNGQLIKSRNYNNQNQIVQHIANDDREHTLGDIPSITYVSAYTNNDKVNPYYIYYTYSPIKQVFNTPYKITTTVASSPSGLVADANGNIVTLGNSTQTVTDLVYNTASLDDNFLLKSQQTVNSKSELIVKEFRRATDYAAPSPTLAYMKGSNVNMVEPIIEEITKLNGTVMSASGNKYILENGRVNLKNTYAYNNALSFTGTTDGLTFGNNYEMKEDFTTYDATSGKLLQYTDRSGVINSFIWGYDNKLPIVSGVGLSYPQLNTAHVVALASGAPGSNAYEVAIRNHASTVGKQVSTYVHNPQVGVVKVTDPLGLKKSFQYDAYNRLQKVIDKDGYTTEQYQYHFRERKQTRILSLSSPKLVAGNLNFGTLTPDMFDIGSTMYERCSDKLRSNVLTISNDGEDDLTIYRMTLPNGFSTIWGGAHTPTVIPAGTSVNVIINFDGAIVQPTGVYAGTISIDSSDMTSGTSQVTVSANYTYRNNSLSFSPVTGTNPAVLDLGTVSGLVAGRYIEITNTGNAPFRFAGFPLGWDGTSDNYSSFTNPDFSVSYYFPPLYDGKGNRLYTPCIEVGETVRIPVTFNPTSGPNGIRSAKLSIITDINQAYWPRNLYKDAVTIQANLQRPISTISMSTNAIDFGSFTEAFKTTPVTISNTGSLGFTVSGISVADGSVASWFSLSPSTWTLDPGTTKEFTLTFQPALKDVTANTTITINNDAMYGDETFAVIGRRYSLRRMVLSTEPSNLLVFDNPNETKSVTITNASISNDNLSVADFSPLNTSLLGWAVTSFSPTVLVPGQSMTMQIMRTGASPADQIITIGSTKNDGVNTFTLKNSVTRLIGVTTSPTTALPAFTTPSISQNITLSNSGNGTLTVGGITSSNPMFTVSPTTLEVAPNSQQIVTVTFTPTAFNFSQQSTTLTFTSNATGGTNTIALTGQRTSLKTIQLSTNSLGFTSTGQQQTVIVSNAGNNYLNITGVSYPNTSNWSASIAAANLAPGQSTTMTVTRLPGTNPEILNIAVLSDKNGGNEVLQVSAVTRKINLSSITFPAFTGSSISQPMTITNSGNSQLNVSNITSSNSRFTISPTSLTVAPNNGQQIVTIVYTPTDFTLQSTTLTITSDATGGVNTVNSSAQRSQLAQLNPSSTMLSVKPWDQTPASILTNTGNVAVTINTAGTNSNPSRFAIAYQTYSSVTWVNAPFPVTLQPGQQLRVVASTTQSGDFSTANGTLTIATTNAGTFTLTLTRSSF